MRTIRTALAALAVLSILAIGVKAKEPDSANVFHVRVPKKAGTKGLQIHYLLRGAFGSHVGFVQGETNVRDYFIDTSVEGAAAETLHAVVYCPGYGIRILKVSSLSSLRKKIAKVNLKSLPPVPLSGKLGFLTERPFEEYKVNVDYLAYWMLEFYGVTNSLIPTFHVANVQVTKDGLFSAQLPDLTRDPVVNSYSKPGEFVLSTRDAKSGQILFELEPLYCRTKTFGLQIAAGYPEQLIFSLPTINRWQQ
jgi:hypothetical protein